MARPKLSSPDQPLVIRSLLWLYEFAASLKVAVVLIFATALVLALATFVESFYGTAGVQYGMYGTWWFTLLNALLALNIFAAAAIRYPWKRYQTGFVITHLGLLTLLFGCLLSRKYGIDAQMPIFEDKTNSIALKDTQHFKLTLMPTASAGPIKDTDDVEAAADEAHGQVEEITIPFDAGTFSWEEYAGADSETPSQERLPWFPWNLAHRDRGVLFDDDGVKLEVLDYYAASTERPVPAVALEISTPETTRQGPDGRDIKLPASWADARLEVTNRKDSRFRPAATTDIGGGKLFMWMSNSQQETFAFLNSQPSEDLAGAGEIVLHLDGKKHIISVEEKLNEGRFTLEDSEVEAEIVQQLPVAWPDLRSTGAMELISMEGVPSNTVKTAAVEVKLYDGDRTGRLVLFSERPDWNQQDATLGAFGDYWVDRSDADSATLMSGGGGSRIDIIQGHDQRLYYRYWNREKIAEAGLLPLDGEEVNAFKMPIGQLKMRVKQFLASETVSTRVMKTPFDKELSPRDNQRAAKVRLTVDDTTEEFWLVGPRFDPIGFDPSPQARKIVVGDDRTATLQLNLDQVDVGYEIRLLDFERHLDPGTEQAAHYGSRLSIEKPGGDVVASDVHLVLNAPIDFNEPTRGRKYRLFQEAFRGPFTPGDGVYETVYKSDGQPGDKKYMTVLTVNYDPGRGVKYAGCLLIVAGIATMFYMRAYFFTRPPVKKAPRPVATPREEPVSVG